MLFGIACSFIYSSVRPWEAPWASGCFPKPALPAPFRPARQDATMGAGCFDRSRQRPPLAPLSRFVGMLGTAVFAAVIDGLRAIHQGWSAFGSTGVRGYGTSSTFPVNASLTPAQEREGFSPALLLPRCLSPRDLRMLATRVAVHSHRPFSGWARYSSVLCC